MSRPLSLELTAIVVLVLPLVWSAAFTALRRLSGPAGDQPEDRAEKRHLLILCAPVVLGMLLAALMPLTAISLPLPILPMADFGETAVAAPILASHTAQPAINWLHLLTLSAVAAYAAIAVFHGLRLLVAQLRLARLVARADRHDALGRGVRLTHQPAPPLAWGRRIVLLPHSLMSVFNPVQIDLIVRHEREHLRRGDSQWFAVLAWIDAIFWFNPFIRNQTRRCRLAAELACDAGVLRAVPQMRSLYAQTLVKTLKHTAGNALPISTQSGVPAVFSPEKSGDYRMRISEIMHPPAARRKPQRRLFYALAAALALPVAVAQFAWSQGAAPVLKTEAAAKPATTLLPAVPIHAAISSGFGVRVNPVTHKTAFHPGADFAAPTGTPVYAAGDGVVSNVYFEKWHMGNVIEIDHGGELKTRYSHLDSMSVKLGDHVTAGQPIGAAGVSGVTTGPHLHFEVWHNGDPVNPASALPAQ